MRQSPQQQTKDFEAISAAFHRSLKSLEIEPARFRALPLRQRKLAIFEAIYKTAKQVSAELDWYEDRSNLHEKKLWDFSISQIAQHQTVLDALIAFVCLGETSFIRPLVSYFAFPEPRWSILIDSVLRAITSDAMLGSVYRIPNREEVSAWRKWAIEQPDLTKLKDFSEILLLDIGTEDVRRHYFFKPNDLVETSFLINRNEFFQSDWKYFDERQAGFCTSSLYPKLKSYQFAQFAESIEGYILENPGEGNFNTLVACTNDWISELRLAKSALKQEWLACLSDQDVSPRTGAVLYQILVYPRRDKKLASEFGEKMLGKESNIYVLAVVGDIMAQSQNTQAIYRIAKAYSEIDNLTDQSRNTLYGLSTLASITVTLWIENLFSREIESLCILGGERHPKKRKLLVDSVVRILSSNDQSLLKLRVFKHSANPSCQQFAKQIEEFHELRKPLIQDLDENTDSISHLVSRYLKLFCDCFNKLRELNISRWLRG
jgi:hypothetical protein